MPRDFGSRDELVAAYAEAFPAAAAIGDAVSPHRGDPAEAARRLAAVKPGPYARTRNRIGGEVTKLSMYLRHGVLELAEVRDAVLAKSPGGADKLVSELGWRDYFQRVLAHEGERVHESLRSWKTGLDEEDYAPEMPPDVLAAETGTDFVDAWVAELHDTGWLHNQQRMKLAAYVVHFRRVHWHAGAEWMHAHLVDGDLGSNHLSWQWVASTFSSKPYLFNAGGLAAVSNGVFDGTTTRGGGRKRNPFDRSTEELAAELFA
ncbi:FAD-binding domain-containing protein [Phycisphaera mikurensis]|nr:FAD-binding domain-containing protein [Phycisphaera mikurensis]MBB6440585.1 deoxyribodipyrimidine photo-lyase [Phycisphaera mikurensis]